MGVLTGTKRNINLHIEKVGDGDHYTARLYSENGEMLAADNFQYKTDFSILTRLEDSAGKNIAANAEAIRKCGSELFDAVFTGGLLEAFGSLRGRPMRLKLVFEKETLDVLRIPWEFMFDGEGFLAADPGITITRTLKNTSGAVKKNVDGRLKTLAVIPGPADLPEFYRPEAEREHVIIKGLMDQTGMSGKMDLHFLAAPTIDNLKKKLDDEEQHILHFTTHGIYSQKEQMCYVLFEDDFGNSKRVDAETLAALLAGHSPLRLVVFSCCHTALAVGHRVLGELPVSLLSRGVPAVIVMQYTITDQSAMMLSEQLFGGICRGIPLDQALTDAREALLRSGGEGLVDFGSPILYSHHPDALLP